MIMSNLICKNTLKNLYLAQNLSRSTVITLRIDRPEQTLLTQIRCRRMQHLIRICTVCHMFSNILYTSIGMEQTFTYYRTCGKELRCPNTMYLVYGSSDFFFFFSSPEHKLRVSYCHHPMSVVRRCPSSIVHHQQLVC